jgi:hypothetical protein
MMSTCTKTPMKPYELVIFQIFQTNTASKYSNVVIGVGAYTNHVDMFLDSLTMTPS